MPPCPIRLVTRYWPNRWPIRPSAALADAAFGWALPGVPRNDWVCASSGRFLSVGADMCQGVCLRVWSKEGEIRSYQLLGIVGILVASNGYSKTTRGGSYADHAQRWPPPSRRTW